MESLIVHWFKARDINGIIGAIIIVVKITQHNGMINAWLTMIKMQDKIMLLTVMNEVKECHQL